MASSRDSLTPLQRDLLRAFFARARGFYLTGGAALAGFDGAHRETDHLDIFTTDARRLDAGRRALAAACEAVGADLAVRQDEPGFHRAVATRSDEAVVVGLVHERAPQIHDRKPVVDGVPVDPPDEILANKLTAIVGRAEIRDIIDVFHLERSGHPVESALPAALSKDGGCTPATLAWVLSQVDIGAASTLPGEVAPEELRAYVASLVARLRRVAFPTG